MQVALGSAMTYVSLNKTLPLSGFTHLLNGWDDLKKSLVAHIHIKNRMPRFGCMYGLLNSLTWGRNEMISFFSNIVLNCDMLTLFCP